MSVLSLIFLHHFSSNHSSTITTIYICTYIYRAIYIYLHHHLEKASKRSATSFTLHYCSAIPIPGRLQGKRPYCDKSASHSAAPITCNLQASQSHQVPPRAVEIRQAASQPIARSSQVTAAEEQAVKANCGLNEISIRGTFSHTSSATLMHEVVSLGIGAVSNKYVLSTACRSLKP